MPRMVNIRDSISDLIRFCSIEQTYFANLEKALVFICRLYAVYSTEDRLNWISQIATSNFKVANCDLELFPQLHWGPMKNVLCTNALANASRMSSTFPTTQFKQRSSNNAVPTAKLIRPLSY
jgi:hypothetical protein